MDFLGSKLLGMAGIQRAYMQTTEPSSHEPKKRERYTGIPNIPGDIGYNSNKETGGSHSTGFFSNVGRNPAVILGMGLTTMALLGMIKRSVMGDKLGTQKYMRYRIIAQFFTITALVAGVTIFAGSTTPISAAKEPLNPGVGVGNSAN